GDRRASGAGDAPGARIRTGRRAGPGVAVAPPPGGWAGGAVRFAGRAVGGGIAGADRSRSGRAAGAAGPFGAGSRGFEGDGAGGGGAAAEPSPPPLSQLPPRPRRERGEKQSDRGCCLSPLSRGWGGGSRERGRG